jgi:hypothetical protein
MPIEATQLEGAPVALEQCPKCHAYPFVPFMRGLVQRSKRNWKTLFLTKQPYCTLICSSCKEIVGHEYPPDTKAPATN